MRFLVSSTEGTGAGGRIVSFKHKKSTHWSIDLTDSDLHEDLQVEDYLYDKALLSPDMIPEPFIRGGPDA